MRNQNYESDPVGETVLYIFGAIALMTCLLGAAFGGNDKEPVKQEVKR